MVLISHIIIALSSLVFTTYAYFMPSRNKLKLAYTLVALTVASGTYLVVAEPAHLVQACKSGLLYLFVVSIGILAARSRLKAEEAAI